MEVNTSELERVSNEILKLSEKYADITTQLSSENKKLEGNWEGDDKLEYFTKVEGLCNRLQQMSEKLKVVSSTLKEIKKNYEDNEAKNKAAASNLGQ